VSDEHPEGGRDWDRFVRRHEGSYGVDTEGQVVAGVGHVDASFSPYAPPPTGTFDSLNAAMLVRSGQRASIREAWQIGSRYDDTLVHTIRVTSPGTRSSRPVASTVVLYGDQLEVRDSRPTPWRPHFVVEAALMLSVLVYLLNLTPVLLIAMVLGTMLGLQTTVAIDRGRRLADDLARPPSVQQVAYAVADALLHGGLSPVGSAAVRVVVDAHGDHICALEGVEPAVSATFAAALDEVLSPMAAPRYVVPRWVLCGPADNADGVRGAFGRLRPDGEVWHGVPTVLGTTGERAQTYARAFDHWVGGGAALFTGSPEGAGVLATHRGSDPFDATTVLRTRWC
jgi:hypothetical protein